MKATLSGWLLLGLALINLALAAAYVYGVRPGHLQRVTVFDPSRERITPVTPSEAPDLARELALREALRVVFGWGRFRGQTPERLPAFRDAYWDRLSVDPDCQVLGEKDLSIESLVSGANYAKVRLKGTAHLLQVNFWSGERGRPSRENPTGWRFGAKLDLIDNQGWGVLP